MGAKFKCKKCKRRFDMGAGREAVQAEIEGCEKPICPLRHNALSYIPKKTGENVKEAANDDKEEFVEVFEETPIGGRISYKELKKKNGW